MGSLGLLFFSDRALQGSLPVTFTDDAGEILVGVYYPGRIEAGVILLEGFGSDQVAMRSITALFLQDGYHVLTFDFSGNGRSPGFLGYDNAETDRLARQVLASIGEFKEISGLSDGRIVLLGHSLGARVALQAADMGPDLAGLVLLGTQVNLASNPQSEFFTGVNDRDIAWVRSLGPGHPPVNLLLLSGEWDDVLTPQGAALLAGRLSGTARDPNSSFGDFAAGNRRDFLILPRLVHNYEIYSPRALSEAVFWANSALGYPQTAPDTTGARLRIGVWVVSLLGLFLGVVGAGYSLRGPSSGISGAPSGATVTNFYRFFLVKTLLWIGALPVGALLAGAFFFIPAGLPTFNLIYVAFLGGYGILLAGLYRWGKMPGTAGRLLYRGSTPPDPNRRGSFPAVVVTIFLLGITAAYARTGWFYVYPLNMRVFWLVLFSLPSALVFWVGSQERELIAQAAPGRFIPALLNTLIGLLPFFLWAGFLAGLGSRSGIIGALQGLLVLGFVLAQGFLLKQLTGNHWVIAFCQVVQLYWLILPQGALFQ